MTDSPVPERSPRRAVSPWAPSFALLADGLVVLGFVAIGQGEHNTADGAPGLLVTASPFLLGLVIMTVATGGLRTDAHTTWSRLWPHGVVVWLGTLVIGMVGRVVADLGGAPLAFILVAAGSLALGLLGRRAVTSLPRRRWSQAASRQR
ncbi:MAG: DUF3054 domain-containing protein [Micrococcus sp.]|nr:DUF3054 domain-containing protein [Micrococcus sp.]